MFQQNGSFNCPLLTLGMKVSPRNMHTSTRTRDVHTPAYTFTPDSAKTTMTARTSMTQEQQMMAAEYLESFRGSTLTFRVMNASTRPMTWMMTLQTRAREKQMMQVDDRPHVMMRWVTVQPSSWRNEKCVNSDQIYPLVISTLCKYNGRNDRYQQALINYSSFPTCYSILMFSKKLPIILFKLLIIVFFIPIILNQAT